MGEIPIDIGGSYIHTILMLGNVLIVDWPNISFIVYSFRSEFVTYWAFLRSKSLIIGPESIEGALLTL